MAVCLIQTVVLFQFSPNESNIQHMNIVYVHESIEQFPPFFMWLMLHSEPAGRLCLTRRRETEGWGKQTTPLAAQYLTFGFSVCALWM